MLPCLGFQRDLKIFTMESLGAAKLFSVEGLVAVITGGGSGEQPCVIWSLPYWLTV